MAFLLGTEYCIESLRNDLNDIQETIDEILVRSGPVKCSSWKSPDKLATELKIKEFLDRFKFGNDEVDNQIAHYSLLELIIDRLLLLIFISGTYIDTSLSNDGKVANSKSSQLSAGLATKKYWNKLTQLLSAFRQINCQNKISNAKQKEDSIETNATQVKSKGSKVSNGKILSSSQSNISLLANVALANKQISNELGTKSTQTNETAFVPCESCARIQTNLKQNADQLINMCHYQNMQSNIGKFRASLMGNQLVGGWLSGDDLDKWLGEQDKDLAKISKQLEFLAKKTELLNSKLSESELNVAKLQNCEKELKKSLKEEEESRAITMKQYEKKLADQKNELQGKISGLESELSNLFNLNKEFEQKVASLKVCNENNESIIIELNKTNQALSSELNNKIELKEKSERADEELQKNKTELEYLKRDVLERTNDLNSERTKLEVLIRNEESLKMKHEVLLESFDKLTAECEAIKKRAEYFEQEKKHLLDSLKTKEVQIKTLQVKIEEFESSIGSLKAQMKKMKENEHLLLRYPDLYGPVEQLNEDEVDVAKDMENQILANSHRINLLLNLNKNLESSVRKLSESQAKKNSSFIDNADRSINSNSDENYFMKRKESMQNGHSEMTQNVERVAIGRPVPLFKLENEINDLESKEKNKVSEKYWNPDNSITSTMRPNTSSPKSESLQINALNNLKRETPSKQFSINKNLDSAVNSDNEDDDNFLKDKHESDQNFLSKLNSVYNNTELKVENVDLSQLKRRNTSSRDHQTSFLYSPSQSSMNSERNTSSKLSNYSTNRLQIKTPIPPAEKMEVVVGKGRRINSASSTSRTSSTKNNLPPTPSHKNSALKVSSRDSNNSNIFKCAHCEKNYNNRKDLDIHRFYCN